MILECIANFVDGNHVAVSISTLSKLPRVLKTYKKSQHIKPLVFRYRLDIYLGPDGKNEINFGQLKLGGRVNKINIRSQMCAILGLR